MVPVFEARYPFLGGSAKRSSSSLRVVNSSEEIVAQFNAVPSTTVVGNRMICLNQLLLMTSNLAYLEVSLSRTFQALHLELCPNTMVLLFICVSLEGSIRIEAAPSIVSVVKPLIGQVTVGQVAPFLSGLVDVESARPGLYCTVKTLLQESSKAGEFFLGGW